MKQKITLQEWGAQHYKPAPKIKTLRLWARECRIYPVPEKTGRTYYVDPDAKYTGNNYGSTAA